MGRRPPAAQSTPCFRSVAPMVPPQIAVALAQDRLELVRAVDLGVAPAAQPAPVVDGRDPACRAHVLRAILLPLQPLYLDHYQIAIRVKLANDMQYVLRADPIK